MQVWTKREKKENLCSVVSKLARALAGTWGHFLHRCSETRLLIRAPTWEIGLKARLTTRFCWTPTSTSIFKRIAPFEKCSIWEMLHLRIAPFEKCSIWEMLDLRNVEFEKCSIWELLHLRIAGYEKRIIWETWGWRQIIHFEKAAISIKMVKFRISRQFSIKEGAVYHEIINGPSEQGLELYHLY